MKMLVVKNVNGFVFHEAIDTAMKNDKRGKFVAIHKEEEYADMKVTILLDDGTAGIAVTKDNDVVSLFKNKKADPEKAIAALDLLIPIAVINGGIRMDCYGEHLAKKYMSHGFIPVARCKFDDNTASPDWDYEANGRPDLYFLVRFTSDIDALVRESAVFNDSYFDFIKDSLPYMEYDEAVRYEIEKTKTISMRPNQSYKQVIESVMSGDTLNQGGTVRI